MPPKILFVDDEPDILEALDNALFEQPFSVTTAEGPIEALEILSRETFDVVVSDERMPQGSGAAFLAQVALRYPDTVRILLTGQATLEAAKVAINEGRIFRFVDKPCPAETLISTIYEALETVRPRPRSEDSANDRAAHGVLQELEVEHPGIGFLEIDGRSGALVLAAVPDVETAMHDLLRALDGGG